MAEHDKLEDLLDKWRRGRLSDEELQEFNVVLRENPQAREALLHDTALHQAMSTERLQTVHQKTAHWSRWAAAAVLLCTILGIWLLLPQEPRPGDVITFGKQLTEISLGDEQIKIQGQVDSRIHIHSNNDTINVELLHGSITASVTDSTLLLTTQSGSIRVSDGTFTATLLEKENDMNIQQTVVNVLAGTALISGSWGQSVLHAEDQETFPDKNEELAKTAEDLPVRELNQRLDIHFQDVDIADIVLFLQHQTDVNIILDPAILESDPWPLSIDLKDAKLKTVFNTICWYQDWPGFTFRDNAIYFTDTDSDELPFMMLHTVIGIPDALSGNKLNNNIERALAAGPDPMKQEIMVWNNQLTLTATRRQHQHVKLILEMLRSASSLKGTLSYQHLFNGSQWHIPAELRMNEVVTINFEDAPLTESLDFLISQTGQNVVIHPSVSEKDIPPITMRATDMKLKTVLKWITQITDLSFQIHDDVVYIGDEKHMRPTIRAYQLFGPENEMPVLIKILKQQSTVNLDDNKSWDLHFGSHYFVHTSDDKHARLHKTMQQLRQAAGLPQQQAKVPTINDKNTAIVTAVRVDPTTGKQNQVMLSMNSTKGIKEGMEFIIYRDSDYIVKAKVQKIFPDLIACIIDQTSWNTKGLEVQASDKAQRKLLGDQDQQEKPKTPDLDF